MYLKPYRLMEEAADDGDPGAAAAEPAAIVAAEPTALQATAAATSPGVPEKFQVKNEDGTLDMEATLSKLSESYTAAEKRIGSGDIPPKTAGEYQITVPKALEGAWDPATDDNMKSFSDKAHALGFTQKQMDMVIEQYGELAPGLVKGSMALDTEACIADLKTEWKTIDEYEKNTGAAVDGLKAYAGSDADDLMARYGNDPKFVRMMSRIGKETSEDRSPQGHGLMQAESVESLIKSDAYRNPSDPQHAVVSAKVKAHYDAKSAQDAKAGNVAVM